MPIEPVLGAIARWLESSLRHKKASSRLKRRVSECEPFGEDEVLAAAVDPELLELARAPASEAKKKQNEERAKRRKSKTMNKKQKTKKQKPAAESDRNGGHHHEGKLVHPPLGEDGGCGGELTVDGEDDQALLP